MNRGSFTYVYIRRCPNIRADCGSSTCRWNILNYLKSAIKRTMCIPPSENEA